MKGLSRLLSVIGVLVLALGGIVVWPGGSPASADGQEAIKLTAPQTVVREYDPLVGADAANQSGFTQDPANCSSNPYCDTIPLELTVSDSLRNSDTEDYFLRLKIEWPAASNNVNAYLYDDPYGGEFYIASGATAAMPEQINLYRPEKKKYLLVVHNNSGVNTGYKLTAAITVEPFGGAPDFGGVNDNPSRPTTTTTSSSDDDDFEFDDSSDDSPAPPPAIVDNGFGPPPPLANVDQDESLSALARDRGDFEGSLAAPDFALQEKEPPPPEPVSGATVALLGGLLPASIVGGGVFWLRRKGGTASAGF